MKPAPFTYHDPKSVADLVGMLNTLEDVKILAGGQSLMPMLNMRFVLPDHLIDISKITDLQFINYADGRVRIGAMTRQCALLSSNTITSQCPIMAEALQVVGHFQTRNRGTIGGSMCHLDPAAELPAIASLYNATLNVVGPNGGRQISFADWPLAYMMPNLTPEEVLTCIEFPVWQEPHGYSFVEFARRHGDFAIVAVACLMSVDDLGKITKVALTVAGANISPVRLIDVENALIGELAEIDTFSVAAKTAKEIKTMADAYYTANYRSRLVGVLVERALKQATEKASRA